MQVHNFQQLYVAELQELRSSEAQMGQVLEKASNAAEHKELKQMLHEQRERSRVQLRRLDDLILLHNSEPRAHKDQAMTALAHEVEKMTAMLKSPALRDAGLISSLQRLGHYEIAAYGTAATYAKMLGFSDDQKMLHQSADGEKSADQRLTGLAERLVNRDALAQA